MTRTTKTTTASNTPKNIPTVPEAEWPYQVPENWQWVYWGEIGDFISGNGFKNEYQGFTNYDIPFYKVGSLKYSDSNGYIYDNTNTISNEIRIILKASLIPTSSILFAKIGEAIRLNRRSINNIPCCIDNNMMAFVSKNCIVKYVYFWSCGLNLYDYTNATTVPAIRKTDLEKIPFPLPPLAEQQRIVDRIERLFAKLDEAREKAQAVVDGFENRKAAILHQAFTGELTKKWREERGIGMDTWERLPLSKLSDKIFDGPFGSNLKTEDYVDSGIRVVRLENIKNLWFDDSKQSFVTKEKYKTIENHTLYPTDLIMATFISDEIKICQMPSYIGFAINKSDCVGIRLKDSINHCYVLFYLSSKDVYNNLLKSIHGATRPRVNTKQIKSIQIPTSSLNEQTIIIQEIEKLLSQERRARDLAESVIAQIDGMKKAILARAFRGELGTNVPGEVPCEG